MSLLSAIGSMLLIRRICQEVGSGQVIGVVERIGPKTGPHLHRGIPFQIRW
mgnify:CR=1 FL=1